MNPVREFIKGWEEGKQAAPPRPERPPMDPDEKKFWRRIAIVLLILALAVLEFHSTIELPYRGFVETLAEIDWSTLPNS